MSVWHPESFSNLHERLKTDPEGASNAVDFTFQTIASKTTTNEADIAALQPAGGITRSRPSNPALYTPFWDSTLNKIVYFQGKGVWKDAMGTVS